MEVRSLLYLQKWTYGHWILNFEWLTRITPLMTSLITVDFLLCLGI